MCFMVRKFKKKLNLAKFWLTDFYWSDWHRPAVKAAYGFILGISLMLNIALFCVVMNKEMWRYGNHIQAKRLYCEALWRCPVAEKRF